MRRLLLGLGALALALTTTTAVNAAEHRRGPAVRHEVIRREVRRAPRFYETHGVRFAGGYYYRGFDHPRWASQVWNARLARWEFFDAELGCSYYWAPQYNCYYPVTYVC